MTEIGPRQPRLLDPGFLAWLRKRRCCVCNRRPPVEAGHIRSGNLEMGKPPTGMGEKPSDFWALPICDWCHREAPDSQHNTGDEMVFWNRNNINPFALAIKLYREYGGTGGKARPPRKVRPRKPKEQRQKIRGRSSFR